MDALTYLYSEMRKENIILENHPIESHKAVTLNIEKDFGIFVDYRKIATLEEEFDVVAHEYGHCATGTTHKLYSPFELISRHEYRADRCAIHKFLAFEKLRAALACGYTEYWELAEYLDLPERFIKLAFKIYKQEGKIT